ncbi:sensor histidine kinase [Martelella soudanensis]|uniref:sensor histidine kinase n=1 Tax=Martelella sp. NC18 TaxID=2740297 RepID=UPI0015DE72B0|nr:sensor histidine kinase [Martelella sp. NC18]
MKSRGIPAQFTKDAVWLRVAVSSEKAMRAVMVLTPTFVEFVDVYVADERPDLSGEDFTHFGLGAGRPLSDGALSGFEDAVPIEFGAGAPKVIYIRATSPNVMMMVNVRFYQPKNYLMHKAMVSTVGGAVIGCMALLLVTQFMLYRFDPDPLYLLLALSTISAAAYHIGSLGYARLLFSDGGRGNDLFLAFFSSFGLLAGAITTMRAFDLSSPRQWMYWVCVISGGVGLLSTLAIFVGLNLYTAPVRNMFILACVTLAAIYGLMTIRRGDWASYLRAAAFLVLWVGMTVMLLYYWNVPGLPEWASKGYAIACLLEALLLTAMLSWRLRSAHHLNSALQEEALQAARSAGQRAAEMVEIRTAELAEAKRTAEAALEAELEQQKSQVRFMEVISHQYRTPLASIRSSVDTMELGFADDDKANHQRIARIRRGIARLVEVLEINLERSRVQGSALEPEASPTPVSAIALEAARRSRDLMPDATIIVDLSEAAAEAEIRVDADMVNLALINLLENAVKYSGPTGGGPVVLSAEIVDGDVRIAVEDQGIGIPSHEISAVLHARVRGSNTSRIKGTGMGLSLVSRIAAAHAAAINIESAEGKGTIVALSFPLAQAAERSESRA